MENEIEKLIKKYEKIRDEQWKPGVEPTTPIWVIVKDLQSLLDFKQKNC